MFKNKPKCYETAYITDYVQACLRGENPEKPNLSYDIHIYILELFIKVLEMGALNNGLLLKLIKESASLSDFDINMSFISKELKNFAQQLAESSQSNMAVVEQTTASMNEVSQAISHHTEVLDDLSIKSNDLIEVNIENKRLLEDIIGSKETVIHNANIMSEKIEGLEEVSKKVDVIVNGVNMIAEQTNLLALNATIEAARAGEYGRGFAVVADEIRKLAENTKTKLKDMQIFTENIRNMTKESTASVNVTIDSMTQMTEKIEKVDQSFEESIHHLRKTVDGISNLASVMQEVNASSEEISAAMNVVANESEKISQMTNDVSQNSEKALYFANNMGKIDEQISTIIKELVTVLNKGTHPISNEDFLKTVEAAIHSHQLWLGKLHEMVKNMKPLPLQTNEKKCGFGHFYYAVDLTYPGLKIEWSEIEQLHSEFHKKGDLVIGAIEQGNETYAYQGFKEAEVLSKKVIAKLNSIIDKTKVLHQKGEKVFRVSM